MPAEKETGYKVSLEQFMFIILKSLECYHAPSHKVNQGNTFQQQQTNFSFQCINLISLENIPVHYKIISLIFLIGKNHILETWFAETRLTWHKRSNLGSIGELTYISWSPHCSWPSWVYHTWFLTMKKVSQFLMSRQIS